MLEKIYSKKFKKNWAGAFGFPLSSMISYHYKVILEKDFGIGLPCFVIISKNGYGTCYFEVETFNTFGENLANKVRNGEYDVNKFSKNLKKQTDIVSELTEKARAGNFSGQLFSEYIETLYNYSSVHRFVKVVVDYLALEELQENFKILEESRLYSEPAYTLLEEFTRLQSKYIAENTELSYEQAHALSRDEIKKYWESQELPDTEILNTRFQESAIISLDSGIEITTQNISEIENSLTQIDAQKKITGSVAYKGMVEGIARIIFDPTEDHVFNQGDILVADMTRPEYIPLIQKASAIVTDAGGMLCHAAISAREFKIPCIVGTEIATKIIQDGDMVEVDANKGTVTKLS